MMKGKRMPYWCKNHPLPTTTWQSGEWFGTLCFLMLANEVYKLSDPIKVVRNPGDSPLPSDKKIREITEAKYTELLPVIESKLTQRGIVLENIQNDLVWELAIPSQKSDVEYVYASPFLLGWILYRLQDIDSKLEWMVNSEKNFLYLFRDREIVAVLALEYRYEFED